MCVIYWLGRSSSAESIASICLQDVRCAFANLSEDKLIGVSPLSERKVLFVSFPSLKRSGGGLNDKIIGFKRSLDECQADPPNAFTFDESSQFQLQFKISKGTNLRK